MALLLARNDSCRWLSRGRMSRKGQWHRMTSLIRSLQMWEAPLVLTFGGPNDSTRTLVYSMYVFRNAFTKAFADPAFESTLRKLFVTPHEAVLTGLVLFVVGAGAGVFGSAFAVRRFLTV